MAFKDVNKNLDETKTKLTGLEEELSFLEDAFTSLGQKINTNLTKKLENSSKATRELAQSFQKDLKKEIDATANSLKGVSDINAKIVAGKNVEKELTKAIEKAEGRRRAATRKINILKNIGVKVSKAELDALSEQYDLERESLELLVGKNKEKQKERSLTGLITDNLAKGADQIDNSGTLSGILKGNFKDVVTFTRLGELSLVAFAAAALQGSKNIAEIAKLTGLSYEEAKNLQSEFNQIALDSNNLLITGQRLNKSFAALTKQTGFIADFGGDTLETFTVLTVKLGLAEEQAGAIATLARLQGEDTEEILENTIDTVNSLVKQSKVSVSVKAILEDVAAASNSIKISLGLSNEELAEAATNAKLFGTNLAGVDAIAGSLVDFESSIAAELQAELLLGKDINLEKARQLALDNDLAGLGEELKNQTAITASFATGNRLQQEAAAKALGLNRDALADIVMQQELANLSAEEFTDRYGETTYQQLQQVSAQEKLNLSMDKFKESIAQAGLAMTPIIDGISTFVAALAQSKGLLVVIGGLMAGLAARAAYLAAVNIVSAVSSIWQGAAKGGIPGLIAAGAGTLAFFTLIAKAKTIKPKDDVMLPGIGSGYGDRMISGPEGSFALNNKDTVLAGTNLGGNNETAKTNKLLQQLLNRPSPTINMDSIEVGTVAGMSAFPIQ